MKLILIFLLSLISLQVGASKVHQHQGEASRAFNEIKSLLNKANSLEKNLSENLSSLEKEEKKLQAEWNLAIQELNSGLYCRGCGDPKSVYERKNRYPDFYTHQRENAHARPELEHWLTKWNDEYRKKVDEIKKQINEFKIKFEERNNLLWKTLEVRDRSLYPSYKGTFNEIVVEYEVYLEKMKKKIKLQEELIEQYDELLSLIPEEDPDFSDYLAMLEDAIEDIHKTVEQIYDRQIISVDRITHQYDSYTIFNEAIQDLARQLNQDPKLGTTGDYIAGNFAMLPLGILITKNIPKRPPSFNGMISTKTLRIIKTWSGKM